MARMKDQKIAKPLGLKVLVFLYFAFALGAAVFASQKFPAHTSHFATAAVIFMTGIKLWQLHPIARGAAIATASVFAFLGALGMLILVFKPDPAGFVVVSLLLVCGIFTLWVLVKHKAVFYPSRK